jgi:tRNA pseudouridine38-40 synthase
MSEAATASPALSSPHAGEKRQRFGPSNQIGAAGLDQHVGRRKKVALLLGYVGTEFCGSQIQTEEYRTIDSVLFDALCASGLVDRAIDDKISKIQYSRCSRTDKGVSAARYIAGMQLRIPPSPSIPERLNEHLPADIRCFGCCQVTGGFHAQKACDERTYSYLMPAAALRPVVSQDIAAEAAAMQTPERRQELGLSDDADFHPELLTVQFRTEAEAEAWSFTEEDRVKLEGILGLFVGSHRFHNYTIRVPAHKAEARRVVREWTVSSAVEYEGVPFVMLRVRGVSFLQFHIRRMVGMAIAVATGRAPPCAIPASLQSRADFPCPTAPPTGLFLQRPDFIIYREKFPNHDDLRFADADAAVEEFVTTAIVPDIVRRELQEASMSTWLETDLATATSLRSFHAEAAAFFEHKEHLRRAREEATVQLPSLPTVCAVPEAGAAGDSKSL